LRFDFCVLNVEFSKVHHAYSLPESS